jgi:hypothetical protein
MDQDVADARERAHYQLTSPAAPVRLAHENSSCRDDTDGKLLRQEDLKEN